MYYKLLINALATWRVSHMLVNEDGPFMVFYNLRQASGIEYDIDGQPVSFQDGNPLMCIYCTSVWVAAAFLFLPMRVSELFAVSALAVIWHEVRSKL